MDPQHEQAVLDAYSHAGLQPASIGLVADDSSISIAVSGQPAIAGMYLCMISGHHVRHLHVHRITSRHYGRSAPSAGRLWIMCRSVVDCICRENSIHHEHINSVLPATRQPFVLDRGAICKKCCLHLHAGCRQLIAMRHVCPVPAGVILIVHEDCLQQVRKAFTKYLTLLLPACFCK